MCFKELLDIITIETRVKVMVEDYDIVTGNQMDVATIYDGIGLPDSPAIRRSFYQNVTAIKVTDGEVMIMLMTYSI